MHTHEPISSEVSYVADLVQQIRSFRAHASGRIASAGTVADRRQRGSRNSSSGVPIGAGEGKKAVEPILKSIYKECGDVEDTLLHLVRKCINHHPAAPWFLQIRGLDLAALTQILARLDVERAFRPSAFWSYCGLNPQDDQESAQGGLADAEAAFSQSSTRRTLKAACYHVGTSLLKADGAYARYYESVLVDLSRSRASMPKRRKELMALRKLEKQFLLHLWLVWRESIGLPLAEPHGTPEAMEWADPWKMIG